MEREIGKLWKWKGKWDFKTLNFFLFIRLPLKLPFAPQPIWTLKWRLESRRKKQISVPSSPASLHCGWTSKISSREQPMDKRRFCLCAPKHFDKSRRCRWLLSLSCGCKLCSKLSLFRKLRTSCRVGELWAAEWWCLVPLRWLRLWRDIIYGGPRGPVNVYDPLRGHSCDSADEAAAVLEYFVWKNEN